VISQNYKFKLIKDKKLEELDDEVLSDFKTRMLIYEDIIRISDLYELESFERPKQIYLLKDPFNIKDGHLTS
jgi:long-subunit acyl-CoA synthetase (AMP-forming)